MGAVLLLVFGSAGSGKSTLVEAMPPVPRLEVLRTDDEPVPRDADTAWRQRRLETWVRRALERQAAGVDVLLEGQSPLGELLAVPSAGELDAYAALLVDCADRERLRRLAARDGGGWPVPALEAFVGWAAWMRGHAADPRHRPEVIAGPGWPAMRWDRWIAWHAGDPRWAVEVLDTTGVPVTVSVDGLRAWVDRARAGGGATLAR